MRAVVQTFIASDTDYICLSQTPGAAGALTINGVGVDLNSPAARVKVPGGFQRVVSATSAGNLSGRTFTIVGVDLFGNAVSEALAGPNNTTVETTAQYAMITSVTIDAAAGSAVLIGIGSTGASNWVQHDTFKNPFSVDCTVDIASTINYTVSTTPDNPNVTASPYTTAFATAMSGATADQTANLATPKWGSRVVVNSSTGGSLSATFTQAG